MQVKDNCLYTEDHEWILREGSQAKIGITDYAQSELGDVVFVELPEVGRELSKGESFASVESVKAVSDIYAPASGKVVEVNSKLADSPELINTSAMEEAWIVKIELSDESELKILKSPQDYKGYIEELSK